MKSNMRIDRPLKRIALLKRGRLFSELETKLSEFEAIMFWYNDGLANETFSFLDLIDFHHIFPFCAAETVMAIEELLWLLDLDDRYLAYRRIIRKQEFNDLKSMSGERNRWHG